MVLSGRRVRDPAALKALAHPVRTALLSALAAHGPLTASQAADLVESSPSNCSWHLRTLAAHGFVREARGGTGRNRPWQVVREGLAWGDGAGDGDERSRIADQALDDTLVEREVQRLGAARASRDREPLPWREATGLLQTQMWLTADEARSLGEEVRRLVAGYRSHRPARGSQRGPVREPAGGPSAEPAREDGPDDVRLVTLVGWLVPSGPHRLPDPPPSEPRPADPGR